MGQARFDVQKVVDAHRGEVTDEQTTTDDEGQINRSRLVIRVPSQFFDDAMTELEEVADAARPPSAPPRTSPPR